MVVNHLSSAQNERETPAVGTHQRIPDLVSGYPSAPRTDDQFATRKMTPERHAPVVEPNLVPAMFPVEPRSRPALTNPHLARGNPDPIDLSISKVSETHWKSLPDVTPTFDKSFKTRSFTCRRLSHRRRCLSYDEEACLLLSHSGRIPDVVDVRVFSSGRSVLAPEDWDYIHSTCKTYPLYETRIRE